MKTYQHSPGLPVGRSPPNPHSLPNPQYGRVRADKSVITAEDLITKPAPTQAFKEYTA